MTKVADREHTDKYVYDEGEVRFGPARVSEHLTGQHNQNLHAGGPASARSRVLAARGTTGWGGGSDRAMNDYLDEVYVHSGTSESRTPDGLDHIEVRDHGWGNGHLYAHHDQSGERAGYVLLSPDKRSVLSVGVMPSKQGQGLGMKMYDRVQDSGVNLYRALGRANDMTPAGKAFALAWLDHRLTMERSK